MHIALRLSLTYHQITQANKQKQPSNTNQPAISGTIIILKGTDIHCFYNQQSDGGTPGQAQTKRNPRRRQGF